MIASSTYMLNDYYSRSSTPNVSAARANLLALAWNATDLMMYDSTADDIAQHAATIELISNAPASQLTSRSARSAEVLCGVIANQSRDLGLIPARARTSLVRALSFLVDASLSSGGVTFDGTSNVLRTLHELTLAEMVPGEAAYETSALRLSLASMKTTCWLGQCSGAELHTAALDDDSSVRRVATYTLTSDTVREMSRDVASKCGEDAELGLEAISFWLQLLSADFSASAQ